MSGVSAAQRRHDAWARLCRGELELDPPTPDDVTVMNDGRRIDTAEKVRELVAEFLTLQAPRSSHSCSSR